MLYIYSMNIFRILEPICPNSVIQVGEICHFGVCCMLFWWSGHRAVAHILTCNLNGKTLSLFLECPSQPQPAVWWDLRKCIYWAQYWAPAQIFASPLCFVAQDEIFDCSWGFHPPMDDSSCTLLSFHFQRPSRSFCPVTIRFEDCHYSDVWVGLG